jgi:hypothetical protein
MSTPTPFTVLQGDDDVACVDGVCAVPAPVDADDAVDAGTDED